MLKVAVVCDSILLRRGLEIFLRDKLTDFSTADVVISDRKFECDKPLLVVSNDSDADIKKPFGKAKLLSLLDNYEKELDIKKDIFEPKKEQAEEPVESLEQQIASLTKEFSERLLELLKVNK